MLVKFPAIFTRKTNLVTHCVIHVALNMGGYRVNSFLISPGKHMLWVLNRSICFPEAIRKLSVPYLLYVFGQTGLSNSFVCLEVLRPSQPNGVMSSAVSLPNHTFTGQA